MIADTVTTAAAIAIDATTVGTAVTTTTDAGRNETAAAATATDAGTAAGVAPTTAPTAETATGATAPVKRRIRGRRHWPSSSSRPTSRRPLTSPPEMMDLLPPPTGTVQGQPRRLTRRDRRRRRPRPPRARQPIK